MGGTLREHRARGAMEETVVRTKNLLRALGLVATAWGVTGCVVRDISDGLTSSNTHLTGVNEKLGTIGHTTEQVERAGDEVEQARTAVEAATAALTRVDTTNASLEAVNAQLASVQASLAGIDGHLTSLRQTLVAMDDIPFLDLGTDGQALPTATPTQPAAGVDSIAEDSKGADERTATSGGVPAGRSLTGTWITRSPMTTGILVLNADGGFLSGGVVIRGGRGPNPNDVSGEPLDPLHRGRWELSAAREIVLTPSVKGDPNSGPVSAKIVGVQGLSLIHI